MTRQDLSLSLNANIDPVKFFDFLNMLGLEGATATKGKLTLDIWRDREFYGSKKKNNLEKPEEYKLTWLMMQ